jgi:transposase
MEEKKKAVLVGGKKPGKYPDEIGKRAIEMFRSSLPEYGTRVKTAQHICELLGIGTTETVLSRVRQTEVDDGVREGVTSDGREEIRQLRRENAEPKRANGILKAASAFFAAGLDRPLSRQWISWICSRRIAKTEVLCGVSGQWLMCCAANTG